jgi:hypothetical protein
MDCLGATFEGWKGGDYRMKPSSDVYIASPGNTGSEISHLLLDYMLNDVLP